MGLVGALNAVTHCGMAFDHRQKVILVSFLSEFLFSRIGIWLVLYREFSNSVLPDRLAFLYLFNLCSVLVSVFPHWAAESILPLFKFQAR